MDLLPTTVINLFSRPAQYDVPYQPERIHDMFCTCGSTRCFGYTSKRWHNALQGVTR